MYFKCARMSCYKEMIYIYFVYFSSLHCDPLYGNTYFYFIFTFSCVFALYRMLEMGILANSDHPDDLQHCALLHLGMHCLLNLKQLSGTEIHVRHI